VSEPDDVREPENNGVKPDDDDDSISLEDLVWNKITATTKLRCDDCRSKAAWKGVCEYSGHSINACSACRQGYVRAIAREDQRYAYIKEHGYPPELDLDDIKSHIKRSFNRLKRLRAMNAPKIVILRERELLRAFQGWRRAWVAANKQK